MLMELIFIYIALKALQKNSLKFKYIVYII